MYRLIYSRSSFALFSYCPLVHLRKQSGVTVIYVSRRNVCPRTYFTSDICSPNNYHQGQEFHLAKTSDMCFCQQTVRTYDIDSEQWVKNEVLHRVFLHPSISRIEEDQYQAFF